MRKGKRGVLRHGFRQQVTGDEVVILGGETEVMDRLVEQPVRLGVRRQATTQLP